MTSNPIQRSAEILGLSVAALARATDTIQATMHKYAHERAPVPPQLAIKLEQMTEAAGDMVPRSAFRPDDWQAIWPEFIPPARPKRRAAASIQ